MTVDDPEIIGALEDVEIAASDVGRCGLTAPASRRALELLDARRRVLLDAIANQDARRMDMIAALRAQIAALTKVSP